MGGCQTVLRIGTLTLSDRTNFAPCFRVRLEKRHPVSDSKGKKYTLIGGTSPYGTYTALPPPPPLGATVATARKEFVFDVNLLEYLATGFYRCYRTGATARKEFIYDVSFFRVLCYWLLQVLRVQQVATNLAVLSDFKCSLPLLVTGLNHVKICLSSLFHIMPKLLLRSYSQHIAIRYCQKQDLDFYFSQ